jgi:hypothetical protein
MAKKPPVKTPHEPDADALDRVIDDQPLLARDLRAAIRELDRRVRELESGGER